MSVHAERIPLRKARSREKSATAARPFDIAGYWLGLLGSYLLLLSLWWYAAEEKIIANGFSLPAGVSKQFDGSFIASVPTIKAAWVILAVCEALVFLGLVASLVRGEFLPHRAKSWLLGSAIGSLVIFALLAFGNSMTGQHAGVASDDTYFAATILIIGLIRLMPPYRSDRWLTREASEQASSTDSD
jgi:hypothetical protein